MLKVGLIFGARKSQMLPHRKLVMTQPLKPRRPFRSCTHYFILLSISLIDLTFYFFNLQWLLVQKNNGEVLLISAYDGCLHGLDVATGEELWRVATGAEMKGAPLVFPQTRAGHAYIGTAFVGSHDSHIRCVFVGPVEQVAMSSTEASGEAQRGIDRFPRVPGSVWWAIPLDGAVYSSPVIICANLFRE